ncbi:venom serine carboxypeptidase [Microplitis demolitor]|uniref:venom serine carboxypeptidase n=1 Tax=Microplitis demolitor TaxID=69319 RepID=UPI0004CCD60C|nr:venom serine carboxypeptidase [Microplitis demolitor]
MAYHKIFNSLIVVLFISINYFSNTQGFTNVYPKLKSYPLKDGEDAGQPLFLTPYIEKEKFDVARKLATVQHKEMLDVGSYAGYLTVNKQYNSNMFFWFFPAQIKPRTAPVVLWLQGGPGASSLFGLFTENGPFRVDKNKTLQMRKYSWSISHNVIYIDNPVGTGFSFTDHDEGYARNETQVGEDLHSALVQFFTLFSELQGNDFYVTGESYAGKYVPALSYTIHEKNPTSKVKINLKGLAIGNGLTDPINQLNYGDYLYQLGLVDFNGREKFHAYEEKGRAFINQSKYDEAFEIFNELLDGDLNSPPTLFQNLTGFNFYFNYLCTKDNNESDWMSQWIQSASARRAIHVGNYSFNVENSKVENHLKNDITRSEADKVAALLQHYKVLIYNGQLDIIVAYPLTENYLMNLQWPGAEVYKKAQRRVWKVGDEIAGYVKHADNLIEILVRNAGHMVPADQPKWAFDLISRLTNVKTF